VRVAAPSSFKTCPGSSGSRQRLASKRLYVGLLSTHMPLRVSNLHALLTGIVKALVQHPDSVTIDTQTEPQLSFLVHVKASDLAGVVGKQGVIVKAIRSIVYGAGAQVGLPVTLIIVSASA
jgi:predicted RNA-binding protein YlqC (UPF0109 family)